MSALLFGIGARILYFRRGSRAATLVALIACFIPAGATMVDPLVALRYK
jgi:hypothetical protein